VPVLVDLCLTFNKLNMLSAVGKSAELLKARIMKHLSIPEKVAASWTFDVVSAGIRCVGCHVRHCDFPVPHIRKLELDVVLLG